MDIVRVNGETSESTLELMEIAENFGLPVETINQAGAYFLRKISNYKKNIVLLFESKKGRIYRPNLWLYVQLKIGRLSESDLTDCIEYAKWHVAKKESFDKARILKLIQKSTSETKKSQPQRLERLDEVKKYFEGL